MPGNNDDHRRATFFREDDDRGLSERTSPAPDEWFGTGRQKYKGLPTLSDEQEYEGWREFFRRRSPGTADPIEYSHPLDNPLLPPGTLDDIQQKEKNDLSSLIYVLEQAADVFETRGHIDLAAECERLCEMAESEE